MPVFGARPPLFRIHATAEVPYFLYICGFLRIHALTRIQNILYIKKAGVSPGLSHLPLG